MRASRPFPVGAVALATLALLAGSATQAMATQHAGPLSDRLQMVAKPSFAKASPSRQAAELSLPAHGAGSILRDRGYVVEVRVARRTATAVRQLRALPGVRVLAHTTRYRTVTVSARAGALESVAHLPRVKSVDEQLTPMVSGARGKVPVCQGSVTSEGDAQLHADVVKSQFGDFGAGVPVGILSDSFDHNASAATHPADDVASGDLPGPGNPCGRTTPVNVLDDSAPATNPGEDEGRAMLQIVHDLAPQAPLSFATAFVSETSFANNIVSLANAGAKVIADDVTYFDEPFFQDGPVAVAVNQVTSQGIPYFSSAANNNLIDTSGRNFSSWETPSFRDAGSCPAGLPAYATHCLDFDPGPGVDNTFGVTIAPGATLKLDLQWAQPWFGVTTDLDAYILGTTGATGDRLKSEAANLTTQEPFEFVSGTNTGSTPLTVQIAIDRCDTTCTAAGRGGAGGDTGTPRVKLAILQNGGGVTETEYPSSSGGDIVGPTIFGHNGAGRTISAAAVPFNRSSEVEDFSSRGPVTHYFGPVNGTTPAGPISPTTLAKPDVAATDCGQTTFFAQFVGNVWRFCGTSAAAPHAAAVAALELAQNPGASVAQVKRAQTSTAHPVGSFGPEAAGAGLIDASKAVQKIDAGPPAKAKIQKHPRKETTKPRATFKFKASGATTFQCKLDKKAFKKCTSPLKVEVKKGKRHSLEVRGVDNVGSIGPASKPFKWTVLK